MPLLAGLHPAVLIFLIVVADGLLSNIAWRLVSARDRSMQISGRVLGGVLALANVGMALYGLFGWMFRGWSWFMFGLFVVGAAYAFRAGGSMRGQSIPGH